MDQIPDAWSPAKVFERHVADLAELILPVLFAAARRCRHELDVVPDTALPDRFGPLAHQRWTALPLPDRHHRAVDVLTPREQEVLALVGRGLTNAEMPRVW